MILRRRIKQKRSCANMHECACILLSVKRTTACAGLAGFLSAGAA